MTSIYFTVAMAIPREYISSPSMAKSTEHYEKFLDLWKNADPGIAEVEDARRRLAELQNN